jgi:hypothetical protein
VDDKRTPIYASPRAANTHFELQVKIHVRKRTDRLKMYTGWYHWHSSPDIHESTSELISKPFNYSGGKCSVPKLIPSCTDTLEKKKGGVKNSVIFTSPDLQMISLGLQKAHWEL